MKSRLESLWRHDPSRKSFEEEKQRIRANEGRLKEALDPPQRKLLLRIMDDKDLIAEKLSKESYARGFRMATAIMIESLYLK